MKIKLKLLVFLIFFSLLSENLFSQANSSKISDTNKSFITNIDSNKTIINEDDIPWHNSFYISGGYGIPQGFRVELGYNIGSMISLAITADKSDYWSGTPQNTSFGIIGKLNFPTKFFTPYILICYGSFISIFEGTDTYLILFFGSKITLRNWLQLCPEIGFDFTSKYISGGKGLFGGETPLIYEDVTRFGFNISMEVDFRQIF